MPGPQTIPDLQQRLSHVERDRQRLLVELSKREALVQEALGLLLNAEPAYATDDRITQWISQRDQWVKKVSANTTDQKSTE